MGTVLIGRSQHKSQRRDPRLRRVTVIWALLYFNSLTPGQGAIIPIPHRIAQLMTQGSLFLAFILVLTINPRLRVRPNWLLGLYSVLALSSLMMSVRLVGLGTEFRSVRLVVFLVVLWLLTPWWGRRDLLFLRSQMWFIGLILGSVIVGLLISPGKALPQRTPQWRDLADLADGCWPLRRRNCRPHHGVVAVSSGISSSRPYGCDSRRHRFGVVAHTNGALGDDCRLTRRRPQLGDGQATGSAVFCRWAHRRGGGRGSGVTAPCALVGSGREHPRNNQPHRSHECMVGSALKS